MLIAYVDESYNEDFYFIGAAIATQEQWEQVEPGFDEIRARTAAQHGTRPDVELHGHEIMGGAHDWAPLRGKHREAAGIYAGALGVARDAGVRYIFRGIDVKRLNARYRYPNQPHSIVLGHLLERINSYTRDFHFGETEPTIVVADEIATQDEHKRQFESYQQIGTPGYRSSKLDRISAPIVFASSQTSVGLQAVDLAVYVHRRRETVVETNPKAQRTVNRLSDMIDVSTHHQWTWEP